MPLLPQRAHRRQVVVFYITAAALALVAVYSTLQAVLGSHAPEKHQHHVRSLLKRDEECRLVHSAPDQCAFVRANCPDEEAGLISYLQLYYCDLPHAKPLSFAVLVVWASLLFSTIGIASSDFLCINLGTIASILGMSESLAGVTFLAFGNGSPDVFSTFAAMKTNSGSLAVGELMGAAGFITAVVAGSMALVKPFKVAKRSFVRDVAFFAVAASFSLVFLADGQLRIWECVGMVAFYFFYVAFVVVWHWWIKRNRRIKLAETSARLHHHIPDHQELEAPRIEIDDEDMTASERTALLADDSMDSFPALAQESPAWKDEDAGDDDHVRTRAMAELSQNMRVSRPLRGDRRNTGTAIRPSLIGALEFRSVLHNLEKQSVHSRPIGLRRYTDDDPENDNGDWRRHTTSNPPAAEEYYHDSIREESSLGSPSGRARAASANAADKLGINTQLLGVSSSSPPTIIHSPEISPQDRPLVPRIITSQETLSPGPLTPLSGGSSPASMMAIRNGLLAPPSDTLLHPDPHSGSETASISSEAVTIGPPSPMISPSTTFPKGTLPDSTSRSPQQKAQRPSHSRAPSIRLPSAYQSNGSDYSLPFLEQEEEQEVVKYKWWPYEYLPDPQTIIATLFPTLYGWQQRSWLDRFVGLTTAAPVFLLTITLPVVESGPSEQTQPPESAYQTPRPPSPEPPRLRTDSEESSARVSQHPHGGMTRQQSDFAKGIAETTTDLAAGPKPWNRWLVILQLFTAPIFVVSIVMANMDQFRSMLTLKLMLGSLVLSLVALLVLLATTTGEREPKYRSILCFLGFTVSIAWIATIANEVVGVLKAFGVIFDISDAILGLTVFAMGNSVGDLVADITIAKLGYPVMALSACFGGPMLNILLGIGMGGMYMTITNAHIKHNKHPDKSIHYKPYRLDVSTTLMISGVALLVTLLGLLIAVPLNGWRMDKKIGTGLISLWVISTCANVVLELVGIETKWEAIMDWLF